MLNNSKKIVFTEYYDVTEKLTFYIYKSLSCYHCIILDIGVKIVIISIWILALWPERCFMKQWPWNWTQSGHPSVLFSFLTSCANEKRSDGHGYNHEPEVTKTKYWIENCRRPCWVISFKHKVSAGTYTKFSAGWWCCYGQLFSSGHYYKYNTAILLQTSCIPS